MINVTETVESAARIMQRRFKNYVDREDLAQVGHLWVLEHPEVVEDWLKLEEEKLAAFRLRRRLSDAMEAYARKERAQRAGFNTDDEAFYSSKLIKDFLPFVLRGEPDQPVTERPEISAKTDPAEGGNWLASFLDVKRAWESADLTGQERTIIRLSFDQGWSQVAIGEEMGVAQQQISRASTRAIEKMQKVLGGPEPQGCPFDCECHEGRLRKRPSTRAQVALA